jgi:mono/diheme cytochrome c family protein
MQSRCFIFLVVLVAVTSGCSRRQAMYNQPKYEPYEKSDFFADGSANRIPPKGTVSRGEVTDNPLLSEGRANAQNPGAFPFEVTRDVLARGQGRFQIFCTPCHSQTGDGLGMIVQRGLIQPPSLHIERLRKAPPTHFFNVITHGIGQMSSYAAQITPEDRWAVIAYIRALQLSQNAKLEDVPVDQRANLQETAK